MEVKGQAWSRGLSGEEMRKNRENYLLRFFDKTDMLPKACIGNILSLSCRTLVEWRRKNSDMIKSEMKFK